MPGYGFTPWLCTVLLAISLSSTTYAQCPGECDKKCIFGYVMDQGGCPVCACQPHPCRSIHCPDGQVCLPVRDQCYTPGCTRQYTHMCEDPAVTPDFTLNCQMSDASTYSFGYIHPLPGCPRVYCSEACEHGFVHDEDGCQTCMCLNPCHLLYGEEPLVNVSCVDDPAACPFDRRCVADQMGRFGVCCLDRCFLPKDVGTCEELLEYFYYDHSMRRCRKLWYTGCGGNANNFRRGSSCRKTCQRKYGSL